ncbi:hypothetical protein N183_30095 [Sinorhizobium sp. Sb3]|nr:hypothetical protein N183_30095 [Sinorhizobium sp. Sb3]
MHVLPDRIPLQVSFNRNRLKAKICSDQTCHSDLYAFYKTRGAVGDGGLVTPNFVQAQMQLLTGSVQK